MQPYQQLIDAQFGGEDADPDMSQIERIIGNYRSACADDVEGTAELYVFAVEAVAGFMYSSGYSDLTFLADVEYLIWDMVSYFNQFEVVYPIHKERLQTVRGRLAQMSWETLTDPFYQLEVDMGDFSQ